MPRAGTPGGRRALNKADKLRRIRSAAKALFGEQGFDVTTTRDIADRAGVALATLFLYASDKRDLLFLACNDDLDRLTTTAFDDVKDGPLLDQLLTAFRHFLIFYNQNPRLSRDLLRELTFYTSGQHSTRFQSIRGRTVHRIGQLIDRARRAGAITTGERSEVIAEVVFFVFAAQVRKWLSGSSPRPEAGLARLRDLLTVVLNGLEPGRRRRAPRARPRRTASVSR
jgi:AcrR family transcriptional regulator